MKKIFFLFFNIYLVIFTVFGQENVLYHEIRQAKEANIRFEHVVFTKTVGDADLALCKKYQYEMFDFNE